MSFNSVDEILRAIIQWEEGFDQFYNTLEDYLKDQKSREIAKVLQERHEKILSEFESIDPNKYAHIEFVKIIPDYQGDTTFEISADASVSDVFYKILEHEEGRIAYYTQLKNIVVFEKSKDLFDLLIRLKTTQVKEINALLNSYDLAA